MRWHPWNGDLLVLKEGSGSLGRKGSHKSDQLSLRSVQSFSHSYTVSKSESVEDLVRDKCRLAYCPIYSDLQFQPIQKPVGPTGHYRSIASEVTAAQCRRIRILEEGIVTKIRQTMRVIEIFKILIYDEHLFSAQSPLICWGHDVEHCTSCKRKAPFRVHRLTQPGARKQGREGTCTVCPGCRAA